MKNDILQNIPNFLFTIATKYTDDIVFIPSRKISVIDKSEIETNSWNGNRRFYPDYEIYDNNNLLLFTIKNDYWRIANTTNIDLEKHTNVKIDAGYLRQLDKNGIIIEFSYDYHIHRVGKDHWERSESFHICVLPNEKQLFSFLNNEKLKINVQIQKMSSFIFDFWTLKHIDSQNLNCFLDELLNNDFWLFKNEIKQYLQENKNSIQSIPDTLGIIIFMTFLLGMSIQKKQNGVKSNEKYEEIYGKHSKIYQIHKTYIIFEDNGVHIYLHNASERIVPSLILFIPKEISESLFNEIEIFSQEIINLNVKSYMHFFI